MRVNGVLDLFASRGVQLNLWTMQGDGLTSELSANFDSAIGRSWLLATATGDVDSWDEKDFETNVSPTNGAGGFQYPLGDGAFMVRATTMQSWLDFVPFSQSNGVWHPARFAPAPEPSFVFSMLAATGVVFLWRRGRSRSHVK